jgi:hypothetical protein
VRVKRIDALPHPASAGRPASAALPLRGGMKHAAQCTTAKASHVSIGALLGSDA